MQNENTLQEKHLPPLSIYLQEPKVLVLGRFLWFIYKAQWIINALAGWYNSKWFFCPSQVYIFIFCKITDLLLAINYISYLPEVIIQLVASWKLGISIAYYICVFFCGVHFESIFLIRKKKKRYFTIKYTEQCLEFSIYNVHYKCYSQELSRI